jgi:hypothetical protein
MIDAINPYSIAVAPVSSVTKRCHIIFVTVRPIRCINCDHEIDRSANADGKIKSLKFVPQVAAN